METKLRQFVQALQLTDAIITAILEDLSRSPNSISKPLEYETHFDETKQFLTSEFFSRFVRKLIILVGSFSCIYLQIEMQF